MLLVWTVQYKCNYNLVVDETCSQAHYKKFCTEIFFYQKTPQKNLICSFIIVAVVYENTYVAVDLALIYNDLLQTYLEDNPWLKQMILK